MICDNNLNGMRRIVTPQCWKGEATKRVTVVYTKDQFGYWDDKDTHYLCAECAKLVKKDARRHGFAVHVKNI